MSTTPEPPHDPPPGPVPPPPPPPPGVAGGAHSGPTHTGPTSAGYPPPSDRAAGYPPGQASGYQPPPPYPAYTPGSPPPRGYAPGAPLSPSDQRLWAVLSHVLTLLVGFFAPLVIWLVFKGRGAFSEDHSRESLNFQITATIAAVAVGMFTVVTLGLGGLLFLPLLAVWFVLVIIASVKASQGEPYRYPLTYRFIT